MTINEWSNQNWDEAQKWESEWWRGVNGACSNTYAEETKQLTYAYKMGLTAYVGPGTWPCYDMTGYSVLDIGGGPTSILLKCTSLGKKTKVIDPCSFPSWVQSRYYKAGIGYERLRGEDINLDEHWDEAWLYNVLQHTEDPELIIMKAKAVASVVRIFEWIDIPPHQGHPQELKEENLNKWLEGTGTVEWLNENNCGGKAYYGVFRY